MYEQTHRRVFWRKLACVIGALLVMATPVLGSLCAPSDCSSQNSKTAGACSGMDMPKPAASVNAQSRLTCCQLTQSVPATLNKSAETKKERAELAPVVSASILTDVVTTERPAPRPVHSPPLHPDVQSLFCTLLI